MVMEIQDSFRIITSTEVDMCRYQESLKYDLVALEATDTSSLSWKGKVPVIVHKIIQRHEKTWTRIIDFILKIIDAVIKVMNKLKGNAVAKPAEQLLTSGKLDDFQVQMELFQLKGHGSSQPNPREWRASIITAYNVISESYNSILTAGDTFVRYLASLQKDALNNAETVRDLRSKLEIYDKTILQCTLFKDDTRDYDYNRLSERILADGSLYVMSARNIVAELITGNTIKNHYTEAFPKERMTVDKEYVLAALEILDKNNMKSLHKKISAIRRVIRIERMDKITTHLVNSMNAAAKTSIEGSGNLEDAYRLFKTMYLHRNMFMSVMQAANNVMCTAINKLHSNGVNICMAAVQYKKAG